MTGLIGKKIGMSQLFDDTGNVIPVTVVETGPCVVVQKKDVAKDGYNALQLGFGTQKNQRVNRPLRGHMAKAEKGSFRVLREFRVADVSGYEVGQELKVTDLVKPGDLVDDRNGEHDAGAEHSFEASESEAGQPLVITDEIDECHCCLPGYALGGDRGAACRSCVDSSFAGLTIRVVPSTAVTSTA